jgi:glutamate racemase
LQQLKRLLPRKSPQTIHFQKSPAFKVGLFLSFPPRPFISKLSPVIGLIDSGVGGFSVLREIRALLPDQAITYIGDNAWCPYGNKTYAEIRERTFALTDHLLKEGAEVIVVACNSATIVAIEALRANYLAPFIGMEPGVKPATALTKTGTIGVLATEASLRGDKFHNLVATHARGLRVITQPCPKFVELVEQGLLSGPRVDAAIDEYTSEMLAAGADVIILGCTHYPFLREALTARLPDHIRFIDTGDAIARRLGQHALTPDKEPLVKVFTTGIPESVVSLLQILTPEIQASCAPLILR